MNKFKMAIDEALTEDYIASIPQFENHKFSADFNVKMKKMISNRKKPFYFFVNTVGKRIAVVIITLFLAAATTVISVEALRNSVFGFFVEMFNKFSIVKVADYENTPKTIDDIYEITSDLNGFEISYEDSDEISRYISYINGDKVINFHQIVKSEYDMGWNTENAKIEAVSVNNLEAIYFKDNKDYSHIIWDNGDYVFSISSNIGKNAQIAVAESVQKVD